jgi:hypothetical protein
MKIFVSFALILALALCAFAPTLFAAESGDPTAPLFIAVDWDGAVLKTPTLRQGKALLCAEQAIYFKPLKETITIESIELETSIDIAVFPFRITESSYYRSGADITDGNVNKVFVFGLEARQDAHVDWYSIPFIIGYKDGGGETIYTRVYVDFRIIAIESQGNPVINIPKVIVSNNSTSPGTVVAGEEFTLSVTFKNTAGNATPTNIKAQLSSADGTFSPVSGSTPLFMDSIAPGGTKTMSIRLKAKADVAPGSYSVTFSINYDVAGVKDPITDTEVLAIPVVQLPKIQLSQLQAYPAEVYVGNDLNIMTSVNNTGKSKLYNVSVKFADAGGIFAEAEQFIGNVEPGASGSVDVYLSAQAEGDANIIMTVTYEDETGQVFEQTDSYSTYVMSRGSDVDPSPIDPSPIEPETKFSPLWLLIIPVVGGIVAALLIVRKKKSEQKRKRARRIAGELQADYLRKQQTLETQTAETPAAETDAENTTV